MNASFHLHFIPERVFIIRDGVKVEYIRNQYHDLDDHTAVNGVERAKENLAAISKMKEQAIAEYNEIVANTRELKNNPWYNNAVNQRDKLYKELKEVLERVEESKNYIDKLRERENDLNNRISLLKEELDRTITEILYPIGEVLVESEPNDNWKEFIVPNPEL